MARSAKEFDVLVRHSLGNNFLLEYDRDKSCTVPSTVRPLVLADTLGTTMREILVATQCLSQETVEMFPIGLPGQLFPVLGVHHDPVHETKEFVLVEVPEVRRPAANDIVYWYFHC